MKKTLGTKTIGIIAFQGGVIEHVKAIESLKQQALEVRNPEDLASCDALIIPGGESTTIGFFMEQSGLLEAIKKRAIKGMPIWGTCAGAILLAKNIQSEIVPPHLELMDITVKRNAYGSQMESFHTEIDITSLGMKKLKVAFIRAPIIKKMNKKVEVLAFHEGKPVLVKEVNLIASTFHPELRSENGLHKYLISLCK